MKTIFAFAILLGVYTFSAFSSNYEEAMKTNLSKMSQTKTATEFTQLAGQFQRIANAEKDKWMPGYYAAYCYVNTILFSKLNEDETHKQLDLAQAEIDKIIKIAPKESEIFTLQSFVYMLRITDMAKGMKYSRLASEAATTAEELNRENPRVYYMMGMNTFHTPKMFGGGKEKAKPYFEKAAKMFESQKPASELMPVWGAPHNNQMLAQCNTPEE